MPEGKGKHLDEFDRNIIQDGIRDNLSARSIAKRLKVAPSTVLREVKQNRIIKLPKRKGVRPSTRCVHYKTCELIGQACKGCKNKYTLCKMCKTRHCIDSCSYYELILCPDTKRWPYICKKDCPRRAGCNYPKCSYIARDAHTQYLCRLVSVRQGINISSKELKEVVGFVKKRLSQGQSLSAIWAERGEDLLVCERTFYNYINQGVLGLSVMDLPKQVRYKKRKKQGRVQKGRDKVDRDGRTYADFLELPEDIRSQVVQGDTVLGKQSNKQRILSLYLLRHSFQLYMLLPDAKPASVVAALDIIERYLGSADAFKSIFGILLFDRGSEFDDFRAMERSCLEAGKKRARVFYCDAMNINQKSQAERNHVELRKILPKMRTDFDALSVVDVATCCSHVNSYPRPSRAGMCPYDLAAPEIRSPLLDLLGVVRIPSDEVVMKPTLMAHAVIL